MSNIILASNSPRRKELLSKIVQSFKIVPAVLPENSDKTDPCSYVVELAQHKAQEVFEKYQDCIVIGCDTVVDLNGEILGKPTSKSNAVEMLKNLSGRTHLVHTGTCICCGEQKISFCETTAVTFRKLTEEEIVGYVNSGAPMDKAGAYGIQDCGFVDSYDGSYDNVMGLPTEKIAEILKKLY